MRVLTDIDFYVQNDFLDDVVNNPEKYNNPYKVDILYDVVTRHINGYKILDYLMLDSIQNNYYYSFINNLTDRELYDDYIDEVKNGNNPFIKAYISMFETPFEMYEDFTDDMEIAKSLVEYGEYSTNERLAGLMKLSTFHNENETQEYIKRSIRKIMLSDKELIKKYGKKQILEECGYIEEQITANQRSLKLKNK